jgi:hypothetical protein
VQAAVLDRPLDPARHLVAAEAADAYVGLAYDRNARWVIRSTPRLGVTASGAST